MALKLARRLQNSLKGCMINAACISRDHHGGHESMHHKLLDSSGSASSEVVIAWHAPALDMPVA
jgi:hypothetical protein